MLQQTAVVSFFDVAQIVVSEQTEQALFAWSHAVELAVDKAMFISHRLNSLRHPWPSLHPKYKGRCNASKVFKPAQHGSVKNNPTGAFNPDVEIFSLKSRLVVKQVPRLKSFQRSYKAFSQTGDPLKVAAQEMQLRNERTVILNAKGFASRWASWILSYELIPFVRLHLPDVELLDLCVDITEMYCNLVCRQESKSRYQSFRHRIQVDHDEGFLSMFCKIVRGSASPPLTEVPFEVSCEAALMRSCKGTSSLFSYESGCLRWQCQIRLLSQENDKVFFPCWRGQYWPLVSCLKRVLP